MPSVVRLLIASGIEVAIPPPSQAPALWADLIRFEYVVKAASALRTIILLSARSSFAPLKFWIDAELTTSTLSLPGERFIVAPVLSCTDEVANAPPFQLIVPRVLVSAGTVRLPPEIV